MEDLLALLLRREIRLTEDFINSRVSEALHDNPVIAEAKVILASGITDVSVHLKPERWSMPASFVASLSLEKLAFSPSEHRIWLKLHSVTDIKYRGALSSLRSRMAATSAKYILQRPQVLAKVLRRVNLDYLSASDGLIQLNLDKLEAFTRLADKEVRVLLINIKPLRHLYIKEVRVEKGSIVIVPDLTKTLSISKLVNRGVPSRATVEPE